MSPQSNIIPRDPRTLTISPLLDRILMLSDVKTDETAAEYQAGLLATQKTGRIRVPLKVIAGTDQIADGRHRREWAIACNLETVPTEEISEEEALSLIREEIFARRSMTKGQKAWLHLWLVPGVADGSTSPKKGKDIECPSLEDAAAEAGVSRSLMKEAAALFRLFATDKRFTTAKNAAEARRAVEERIWSGDGLGQILSDLKPVIPPAVDPGPVDPALQADALQTATIEKYTQLLTEWETETDAAKSYALLPDAALHNTCTKLSSVIGTLAKAMMARPSIMAAQKGQLLAALKEALQTATEAAALRKPGPLNAEDYKARKALTDAEE